MSHPSLTARRTWRSVIRTFSLDAFLHGRTTALIYVRPGADFTIEKIEEALTPDELPDEAIVLADLSNLCIEPRDDTVGHSVNRKTGEVIGPPRLRPEVVAAEIDAIADRLLAAAWAQAVERAVLRRSST